MESEATKAVSKGALSFFSGTFISRISGFGRDLSMAFFFGSHPAIAAFMIAYRFSNLFRRVLGEGAVSSGFIPYFESLRSKSSKEGALFFRDVFFSLFLVLVSFILFLSLGVWGWMEYGGMSVDTKEIMSLTLLMLPGLLFICLYAISAALLQCEKKFFLSGVAPVLFNLTWISAVILFRDSLPSSAVIALSWAVVLGFFLQWALLLPSLKSYMRAFLSWREIFSAHFFSKEVKALLKPFFLSLVGVSATQVNSLLDALFARCASLEGPAYLWYAIRIEQLPLALFGIALSSALLPPLARAISKGIREDFDHLLKYSLSKSFHFIFPCMVALFVLSAPGVNLLYGRGGFSEEATAQTVLCLWGYGIGLLPSVFVLLLAPAFYAQKNFKLPMVAALLSVVLNVILNGALVFGFQLGAMSIAISTSLTAWFNFLFLSKALGQKELFEKGVLKGAFCALLAGGITLLVGYCFLGDATISLFLSKEALFPRNFMMQFLQFFTLGGTFVLMFLSFAWVLDVKEVLSILRISKKESSKL